MVLDLNQIKQAATRYNERVGRGGSPRAAQMRSARTSYLSRNSARDRAKALVYQADATTHGSQTDTLRSIAQERIIGRSDLLDVNYLELAIAVARGVARIKLRNGFATGFLVGPGVLMTNNHVFGDAESTLGCEVQFDYQENSAGELLPTQGFQVQAQRLFFTDRDLDFTLVAVAGQSSRGQLISAYPWTKLIGTTGKADKGDPINIIQHPLGQLKQIAFRDNEIIELPATKKDFLYYSTDTQPGSSGAPCFNDQWELVALHHMGVPEMKDGVILKKDGTPYREKVDPPDSIHWIANEGARISAIVATLNATRLEGEADALRDTVLSASAPNPVELARSNAAPSSNFSQSGPANSRGTSTMNNTTMNGKGVSVVVKIANDSIQSVVFESDQHPVIATAIAAPPPAPSLEAPRQLITPMALQTDETTQVDQDWENREGYDPQFLGKKVTLPVLTEEQSAISVVVPPEYRRKTSEKYLLNYHHYSLVMNAKRRMAWFSAANIDGDNRFKFARGKDKWFIDPRIDDVSNPRIQMGEELYAEANTDRGHLTRYLDVAWGATKDEAMSATNDSFHFTNCALQLSGFNQGKDRWQGLEQFLLEQHARKEKRRMTVMTGPVFKRNDPVYQNKHMDYSARIPLQFWKVCALVREDESLAVTAFIMGQQDIAELPGFEEAFDVIATQVTLAHLESITKLDFGKLKEADHLAQGGAQGTLELDNLPVKPLRSVEDVVI